MKRFLENSSLRWFFLITLGVTLLCQTSFIQAAFNPMVVAMSSGKAKAKNKAKATAQKSPKKTGKTPHETDPFINNKTLKKIYGRQARRSATINAFKKKGVLGEADSGLVKVRTTKGLSKKEKEILGKFVKAENGDRKKIIAAVLKGGRYTKDQKKETIKKYFELNRAADPKGSYYYQAGQWVKVE